MEQNEGRETTRNNNATNAQKAAELAELNRRNLAEEQQRKDMQAAKGRGGAAATRVIAFSGVGGWAIA